MIGKFSQNLSGCAQLGSRESASAFFIYGGLALGNSVNEAKGFTDKAKEIFNGFIPFNMPDIWSKPN